jgi:phage terminase large subunit
MVTISDAIIFREPVKIENFETPPDAHVYFGADCGFANDPTALVRSFIQDERLYIDQEAFGHQVEIDDYIRRQGFNISAADKWPGSVEDGIARHKGFQQIVIHEDCADMQRKARRYSYKADKQTGDILPIVVDKENHRWDAQRYAARWLHSAALLEVV